MSQPRPVKICTLGESGAGKSSLIMRLTTGNFSASQVRKRISLPVPLLVHLSATPQISNACAYDAANNHWGRICRLELS